MPDLIDYWLIVIGGALIIIEFLVGLSVFFFAILGGVFIGTGLFINATGLVTAGYASLFALSLLLSVWFYFFRKKVFGKTSLNNNLFDGKEFVAKCELPKGVVTKNISVFGLNWNIKVIGGDDILIGDKVIVDYSDVNTLTVHKLI